MTRIQEIYRIIDLNKQAIELLEKDIQNRYDEIEKSFKELDELCRI